MKRWKTMLSGAFALCILLTAMAGCTTARKGGDDLNTQQSDWTGGTDVPTEPPDDGEEPAPPLTGPITLYNGIVVPGTLPDSVSPTYNGNTGTVPYLLELADGGTHPEVVDISVGRQLFVDNFLIEHTDLTSTFHPAQPYSGNPILVPDVATDGSCCLLASAGVWYDAEEELFKMFYMANWTNGMALATSRDGIHWEKPDLGTGSNLVWKQLQPDSTTVWFNPESPDPAQRYVLFVRTGDSKYPTPGIYHPGYLYTSPDGIDWSFLCATGDVGDRSSIFYNAFTGKWCYSIRSYIQYEGKNSPTFRARKFFQSESLSDFANSAAGEVWWVTSDEGDKKTEYVNAAEIYSVDAIAYESILLSIVELFEGPDNTLSNQLGIPKVTELTLAFSRDGFWLDRSQKEIFISASQQPGAWDQGYLSPAGGICITVGDQLYFYYSGFAASDSSAYARASVGLATLRRDGFVSLDGSGTVLTRKLTVSGDRRYLFVNAKTTEAGSVKAEILDADGNVVPGYSVNDCVGFTGDSTCTMLSFGEGKDLSFLNDTDFRIRFYVEEGEFYSFWLSDELGGESHGYHAAGLVEPPTA